MSASSATFSYSHWEGWTSELPLIAEFCSRAGYTALLINAIADGQVTPGLAILLHHVGQMVALNYTIFTDAQYSDLTRSVQAVVRGITSIPNSGNQLASAGRSIYVIALISRLKLTAANLNEHTRKAQYFYLKNSLTEGMNVEINQDKEAVQSRLKALGFSEPLSRSLDEAERLYLDSANTFTLKAAMAHLRSFLENLHSEVFLALHAKFGGDRPTTWGSGLSYMKRNSLLLPKEETLVASLYTIISDEAIHPLIPERQYARLFRNMVIEYALLFLWKVEKAGLTR